MTDVDPLLERIDRDLAECDARTLPPLAECDAVPPLSSEAEDAVSYFARLAGRELSPWQHHRMISALWPPNGLRPNPKTVFVTSNPGDGDDEVLLRMRERAARSSRGFRADLVIVDEVLSMPEPPPEVTFADLVRVAHELEEAPKLPEKIKMTSGEWDAVVARYPRPTPRWGGVLGDPFGVPVELVDDPKESTLYWPPAKRGWLRRLLDRARWWSW